MTERFNLSEWALRERSLVWYFILVSAIAGAFTYVNLGREEDPSFTIKTMLIQAQWPGASIEDTLSQVTERIEKKLEELESLDYTKSMTTPGQTTVYVNLKNTTDAAAVPATWVQVRNMINDIRSQFPEGVVGPAFNDRFGDVFGNIYAFTADGLTQRQLRDYVEAVRAKVLTVPNAGRVELIGAQDEVIFLEFSTRQLAALGIDQQDVIATLQGAERNLAVRRHAGGAGAHQPARRRPVQLRGKPAGHQPARQRPLLPPQRRRDHLPRLHRPADRRCSATRASRRSGWPSA